MNFKCVYNFIKKYKLFWISTRVIFNFIFISKSAKKFFEKSLINPYDFGEENLEYAKKGLIRFKKNFSLAGKVVLELGPGGSYFLACLLLKEGVKKIYLLDSAEHVFLNENIINAYKEIYPESIKDSGLNKNKLEVLNYKSSSIPLVNESCDIIYSNAVLEHVKDAEKTIAECYRVLKRSGIMMHQIDFRDHIFDQKSLFFLKLPKFIFDFLFSNIGGWVNRLRYSDWKSIFSKYNLKVRFENKEQDDIFTPKAILRKYSKEDIEVTGALFVLEKEN